MTWQNNWLKGCTPWDAGRSPPALKALVESRTLPRGNALVPGCGSGYDVLTLAGEDRWVVGLDLSPRARERFEALRGSTGPTRAVVLVEDFFTYRPAARFQLIWDYTFLCALEPDRRAHWAHRIDDLLDDEGELVTLIFPVVRDRPPTHGPPYPLLPEHLQELLEDRWRAVALEPVSASLPGREGKEWLGRWKKRPLPTGRVDSHP